MTETVKGEVRVAPNFALDLQEHLIDRGVSVLGIRRSGKSWTIGRICEQLLDQGQPIIVVDLMGEYHTLRERFPILIAALGSPEYADIGELDPGVAGGLAEFLVGNGLSAVIDLKYGRMIRRFEFLAAFLEAFYHMEEKAKRPYVLIMDEGHRITPEKGVIRIQAIRKVQSKVEAWVYEVGATGGHYGIGFIVAARRSAEISKMVLSQTEIRIIHKLVDPTDLSYISSWLTREQVERVRNFGRGEAVVVGLEEPLFIKVGDRICSHGGGTPLAKPVETPELHEAVTRLKEMLSAPPPEEITAPAVDAEAVRVLKQDVVRLEDRCRDLESRLAEERARAEGLEATLASYRSRISELEARIPDADRIESERRALKDEISRLQALARDQENEIRELRAQIEEASESLMEQQEIQELLGDWKDIMIELASKFGVEIVPSDIQKIIDERNHYERLYRELQAEIDRRKALTEDVVSDRAVRLWVREAKRVMDGFLSRRSYQGRVLVKLVSTDPQYLFLPEEFPEVEVTASTVLNYLNEFAERGLAFKHERAKYGRTAFSNRVPLWVSENVRRIRFDAPDEAIEKIVEELKEYVLKRIP